MRRLYADLEAKGHSDVPVYELSEARKTRYALLS